MKPEKVKERMKYVLLNLNASLRIAIKRLKKTEAKPITKIVSRFWIRFVVE